MPAVEVIILGKKHVFNTMEDPEHVRSAAALFEKRVKAVAEDFSMISNERTLVLAAVNIADELIRLKTDTRMDKVEDFLQGISDRLELGLRDNVPEDTLVTE
jgi:cell division protein ZapA (FtsZ GTPase activity inhibitor)